MSESKDTYLNQSNLSVNKICLIKKRQMIEKQKCDKKINEETCLNESINKDFYIVIDLFILFVDI